MHLIETAEQRSNDKSIGKLTEGAEPSRGSKSTAATLQSKIESKNSLLEKQEAESKNGNQN